MGPDNQPQPAPPPGMMERLGQMVGVGAKKRDPKFYDLRNGTYSLQVSVGKSFPTQREENAEMLRAIIESAPGLTPMLADLMVEQLDTPIAKRAAERLRKMNPQAQDNQDEQVPPQIAAQLQQLQEQNQMLTETLKQQNEELKANRYKVDADYDAKLKEIQVRREIAMIQAQAQIRNTDVKAQTDEEIAEMKLEADLADSEADRQLDGAKTAATLRSKEREQDKKLGHEKQVKFADAVSRRSEQESSQRHDSEGRAADAFSRRREQAADHQQERATKAGDAVRERRKQVSNQEHDRDAQREGERHELTKTTLGQKHETKMAEEQRKADAAKAKSETKK